jgi:hypothetical protein
MEEPASARLLDYFAHVSDPRGANARHRLFAIFVIALGAVISGAEGWEDMEEYGQDNGAQNMAVLRHMALHLLRREAGHKRGIKARRKRAGWDRDYLLQVLTG